MWRVSPAVTVRDVSKTYSHEFQTRLGGQQQESVAAGGNLDKPQGPQKPVDRCRKAALLLVEAPLPLVAMAMMSSRHIMLIIDRSARGRHSL